MKITYCMMTWNRLYEVMQCIKRVKPYVDRIVIVDGGSSDDTIITLRNMKGVELYLHPWKDNFSQQRTHYLRHAEENGGTDWILVSDPDELFAKVTLENLRGTIEAAGRYNMIAFESHSVRMEGDEIVHQQADNYWKPLLFKWNPYIHYVGNPHETLIIEGGPRIKQINHHYYHIKQDKITWLRGARNAWIGGGGPNLGERHPLWRPFRELVKKETGVESWHEFDRLLISGEVPQAVKDKMYELRKEDGYDGASEYREIYKLYFRIYHPEQEPEEFKGEHIP